jgi:hypothetical protein
MVNIASQIVAPPYHVQTTQAATLPSYEQFPQHRSVEDLWLRKWRMPCSMGIYPFMDGKIEDSEPIFQQLIAQSNGSTDVLYDPDAYASPFQPVGDRLVVSADDAARKGDKQTARELYLRAAAVYRISRFPIMRSPMLREVWEKQKKCYAAGAKFLDPPLHEVDIPFKYCDESRGDQNLPVPAYLRIPSTPSSLAGHPVLLFICGLEA